MNQIDELFLKLFERGGSDLHVSAGRRPMIRESGQMVALDWPVMKHADIETFFFEIMPDRNREEFQETNDTDFAYEVPNAGFRLRCNVFRDRQGAGGVFRVIPTKVITAEELGLPKAITDLCYLSKGLVLVTGPTGSGKSTTLAAMVDMINRTLAAHVITIEDPIEFVHEDKKCLFNQREVHNHTGSFARALRAALREDPNIVLVGEMRDLETIEIAIETAETGHLVFGTLHTNTAVGTVNRIIDAFPTERQNQIRTMLASSLKGAICQTLCRKKTKGRVAALEVLIVNQGVSAMIRDGKTHQIASAMQLGGSVGMRLLNESLMELVKKDLVEPREAFSKAVDRDDMLVRFKKAGIPCADLSVEDSVPRVTVAPKVAPKAEPLQKAVPAGGKNIREITLDEKVFHCMPLADADLSDMTAVYIVVDMGDNDGLWRVIDVLQPADIASEVDSRARVDQWFANCPSKNMWVGAFHMPDGRFTAEDRQELETRIRKESGLPA